MANDKSNSHQNAQRKGNQQILGDIGSWHQQTIRNERKVLKEYLEKARKSFKTKPNSRNLNKGIDTWAVSLVRHSGPFLKWTREELKQIDQRIRKLMPMHKALHTRDDVDRLYVSRREGGRELASIEDNVDASIQRLEDYIQKHGGRLIKATRNNTNDTRTSRKTITRK